MTSNCLHDIKNIPMNFACYEMTRYQTQLIYILQLYDDVLLDHTLIMISDHYKVACERYLQSQ